MDQVKSLCKPLDGDQLMTVWSTAVVVCLFQVKLAAMKDEWELVAKKARGYLAKQVSDSVLSQVMSLAESKVKVA